jgi:hypothetical protein
MANHFSNRAIIGLKKIGDVYCPKNGEFPAYSEVAGVGYLDHLTIHVPADDFTALNLALAIFSFLPKGIIEWLVLTFQKAADNPSEGILPSTYRQLNLGLRGLVFSTYYSELINPEYKGKTPLQIIDYHINRIED